MYVLFAIACQMWI